MEGWLRRTNAAGYCPGGMPEPETLLMYHRRTPALLVVDDFYRDPDRVRRLALEQWYAADLRYFKGQRSTANFLFPYVKEEFERLIQREIVDWMGQTANGCFQKTTAKDPLVWHSDGQDYAAAVYLTQANTDAGTSFWAYKPTGDRRPSPDPAVYDQQYSEFNLTHPDAWRLVDRIGSVYNRLVIWDAKLVHSASSYEGFNGKSSRLAQLFFFNVKQ